MVSKEFMDRTGDLLRNVNRNGIQTVNIRGTLDELHERDRCACGLLCRHSRSSIGSMRIMRPKRWAAGPSLPVFVLNSSSAERCKCCYPVGPYGRSCSLVLVQHAGHLIQEVAQRLRNPHKVRKSVGAGHP